ncbi:MAG TPA: hypothetical protein V6D07_13185 [Trichocoleus sp.]
MKSLHSFCTEHDLPKTSVRRKAQDLGFDTSNGLSTEAQKALLQEFRPDIAPQKIAEVTASTVTVEVGQSSTLAIPQLGGMQIDLTQFRDSNALVIDDPLAVAQQFLAVADTVIEALDQDAAARETRLLQTRQAREAVTAKAQEMQLEQRLYRERARAVDAATTAEAQSLQQALTHLQSLGKPVG